MGDAFIMGEALIPSYSILSFPKTEAFRRISGENRMKSSENYRLVLVACANHIQAKLIARSVVEKRLAACVNILRIPVESHYHWKGKVEKARELLLLIKTTSRRLGALEREVERLHSYEVPEFIALPIVAGSKAYLDWLDENT
jgi:periplasmic divalent cation tolerance protein